MSLLLCLALAMSACNESLQQASLGPGDVEVGLLLSSAEGAEAALQPTVDPGDGVRIRPGDNVHALIGAHPAGTTFIFEPGVHRLSKAVDPRDGDTFIGESGAILSGARLLSEFSSENGLWVADGQTQQGMVHGNCSADSPRCDYPEDLFIDDIPLKHVASLNEVRSGTWFFNYDANKIYFADDPTGRTVETSVAPAAFFGGANEVTIQGLVIEKFANSAQHGAIHSDNGENWLVEGNTVRLNHGVGIRVGGGGRILNNKVLHNGQMGMASVRGNGTLVEGNEIAYNNFAGFDWGWEAGGTKFVRTENLVLRSNHVHSNNGPGLWSDIDNIGTLYENNLVEGNFADGIFHEISYDAVIRHNTIRNNGLGCMESDSYCHNFGAGINIYNSANVEIYDNILLGNYNGVTAREDRNRIENGAYGQRRLVNLYVHDNTIELLYWPNAMGPTGRKGVSSYMGIVGSSGNLAFASAANNRFENNVYFAKEGYRHWRWAGNGRTFGDWQRNGQDKNGRVIRSVYYADASVLLEQPRQLIPPPRLHLIMLLL